MGNLLSLWVTLDLRRRILLVSATLGVFLAVLGIAFAASRKDMALLYAGLDPSAAAQIVAALEQSQSVYEVRGDAIYVEASTRDLQRIELAGAGLPNAGPQGYELLDSLSGFGTTSQMFDAAYWRAKEGELARTILAMPQIKTARVHISPSSARGFQSGAPASAAVNLTTQSQSLTLPQAEALRALVAAAVPGLEPQNVSVIDSRLGLIGNDTGDALADSRISALRERVKTLLEAHVGMGNALVEISLETVSESEAIRERRIDPESRSVISSETVDNTRTSQGGNPGAVTVASNLPDGAAQQNTSTRQDNSRENRSLTNFDMSETEREILRAPGAIKRQTVAVLINQPPNGAREESDLTALRDLVSAAVGFDETRGDVLTLRALHFEPLPELGTEALPFASARNFTVIAAIGALLLLGLGLAAFVLRPLLKARALPPLPPLAPEEPAPPPLPLPLIAPVTRLKGLMSERREESSRLLQAWVEDSAPETREL